MGALTCFKLPTFCQACSSFGWSELWSLIFDIICFYSWINSLDHNQCIDIYLLPMVTCKFLIFLSAGWWFLMMWNLMQFSAFDCPQDLSLDQINPIGLNFDHPCRQKRAPLAAVLSLSLCGALHCEREREREGQVSLDVAAAKGQSIDRCSGS